MKKPSRNFLFLIASLIVVVVLLVTQFGGGTTPTDLTFSELEEKIASGEIVEATVLDRSHEVTGTLRSGEEFRASFPSASTDEVFSELRDAQPEIALDTDPERQSIWLSLLYSLLPILLLVGVFFYFINSMQGGGRHEVRESPNAQAVEGPAHDHL